MNNDINEKIVHAAPVPPFVRFVASAVPMVFDNSLSYYEALCALWKWMQDNLVNVINNNASVTEHYIELTNELKEYVENYFANLDVQDEINNKLDEMAEAGTLQEIITSYIQANVAWTFDSVADMKASTNLIVGSYARTLGFYNANDGGGALYYITDSGTADEKAVIAVGDLFANIAPDKIVSPEQYGAYGDGTNDDTTSWQLAVNSGRSVFAKPTTYLCGKIEVTENISIDCNHAKFICNADTLFEIKGELETTLTSQTNYTAYNNHYVIANEAYSDYTGFAVLKGDNNFQESRDYYKGGFVANFKNGVMNGEYPIGVTNTSIEIITPITGELKNIDGITHTAPSTSTISINILYGLGYRISNVIETKASCYKFIQLSYCMNCICDNLNISMHFESSSNNSYIVDFDNASFCSVLNSTLHNDLWHDITTGGFYLCYANMVQNCHLTCNNNYAYEDHDNARGTIVRDSTIQCVGVSGLGVIENVIVKTNYDSYKRCLIKLTTISEEDNAVYNIKDCTLQTTGAGSNYCGIQIGISPQVDGKTYYCKQLNIDNVNQIGTTSSSIKFAVDANSFATIKEININNSMLDITMKPNTQTYVDVSGAEVTITNCNKYKGSHYISIGGSGYVFNKVNVINSHLWRIIGTFTTVNLNGVDFETTPSSTTVITNLYGSNVKSFIRQDCLLATTSLMISDMVRTGNDKWFNICNTAGAKYYQHISGTTMVTEEVTYS